MENQKLELVEILPELKEKRENFLKYGSVVKPVNWQKIDEVRAYNIRVLEARRFNLNQLAERQAYWDRVEKVRAENLALKIQRPTFQDRMEARISNLIEQVKQGVKVTL